MPKMTGYGKSKNMGMGKGMGGKMSNTGKAVGDKGMKAKGNRRTKQVADRYK